MHDNRFFHVPSSVRRISHTGKDKNTRLSWHLSAGAWSTSNSHFGTGTHSSESLGLLQGMPSAKYGKVFLKWSLPVLHPLLPALYTTVHRGLMALIFIKESLDFSFESNIFLQSYRSKKCWPVLKDLLWATKPLFDRKAVLFNFQVRFSPLTKLSLLDTCTTRERGKTCTGLFGKIFIM